MRGRPSHHVEASDWQADGLAQLARLRQGCYRFLSALFLYPEGERSALLVRGARELLEASDSLAVFPFFGRWQRLLTTLKELGEGRPEAEKEYVRLFVVNPQAPPYESFYIDPKRQATGWITAQLVREYSRRGLTPVSSLGEPPDHVAVELEFMAFLCSLEARAWEEEDLKRGFQIQRWQRRFLDSHLQRWIPAFARQVTAASKGGVYALAAEAAYAFVHHDRDLVALALEAEPFAIADGMIRFDCPERSQA